MSTIQDGTRSDEARARVEDRNNLDAINKIYVGTGESITVNGHTVWQTEGKNIIKAINDAGPVANATNAASATNADYATNAGSATTADQATNLTSTGKIGNYNTNEIINFDNGFVRNADYATNAGTANAAIDTNFSRETFKSSVISNTSSGLSEAGFYYIYFVINSQNINLGLIYWDGKNDSYSPIMASYRDGGGSFEILCDEYFARIYPFELGGKIEGKIAIYKKSSLGSKPDAWASVSSGVTIYYKKIR